MKALLPQNPAKTQNNPGGKNRCASGATSLRDTWRLKTAYVEANASGKVQQIPAKKVQEGKI